MPSPFPGLDPFIEQQCWEGFHTRFVTALGDALVPKVRPRYIVDVETYVYLVGETGQTEVLIAPDVTVADDTKQWRSQDESATIALPKPAVLTLPAQERIRQHYLTIEDRQHRNVVTVIELLSPWNKASGDGQNEYLNKRQNVLSTMSNVVEIDLLRRGTRLPTVETLPEADYYAFVCRKLRLPKVDVYSWTLREPLPSIPIPLADDDPDTVLDLQAVFSETYDRAGYDYAIDYEQEVQPPLDEKDAVWAAELLTQK
jgi:hypothetical protein